MGLLDRLLGLKKTAAPAPPEPGPPPVILAANVQGIGEREEQEDSFALLNATDPETMVLEKGLTEQDNYTGALIACR